MRPGKDPNRVVLEKPKDFQILGNVVIKKVIATGERGTELHALALHLNRLMSRSWLPRNHVLDSEMSNLALSELEEASRKYKRPRRLLDQFKSKL